MAIFICVQSVLAALFKSAKLQTSGLSIDVLIASQLRSRCSDSEAKNVCKIVSRTRKKWKPDSRGYYTRQIGWVVSKSGNKQQKFLLGKDLREAEFRERKLRELWDRFAASNNTEESRSS